MSLFLPEVLLVTAVQFRGVQAWATKCFGGFKVLGF